MQVSSTEFQKQVGLFQDKALSEPIFVTRNGRERTVLLSADEYRRLYKLARRSMSVTELTEQELEEIAAAEVPAEYAYLDAELN